ncbi:MAG: DUF3349 domain-containing protein [Jatrophihabitans sp.]|uniref:DUF3349 domain-containing protein n=1 Tax=Jatrophihabitans sp. TaxID=1932789 RepID=UPI003F7DF804
MTRVVSSILSFLHAGYPDGIPPQDYVPLLALLRRRLTDDEVAAIADQLADARRTESVAALHAAITDVTREAPRDEDLRRVQARLAAGGWPLADLSASVEHPPTP